MYALALLLLTLLPIEFGDGGSGSRQGAEAMVAYKSRVLLVKRDGTGTTAMKIG
jgi:hypothetical protein